jgi:hypothetical protein
MLDGAGFRNVIQSSTNVRRLQQLALVANINSLS